MSEWKNKSGKECIDINEQIRKLKATYNYLISS